MGARDNITEEDPIKAFIKNTLDVKYARKTIDLILIQQDWINLVIEQRKKKAKFLEEELKKRNFLSNLQRFFFTKKPEPPVIDINCPINKVREIDTAFDELGFKTGDWENRLEASRRLFRIANTDYIDENNYPHFQGNHVDALIANMDFMEKYPQNQKRFDDIYDFYPIKKQKRAQQKDIFDDLKNNFLDMASTYRTDTRKISCDDVPCHAGDKISQKKKAKLERLA